MDRREFAKLSLAVAAGAACPLLARAAEADPEPREVSRTTGKAYKMVPSTCLMCYARCGIYAYLAYGRVAKIGGNPAHPNSRGRLCAKGQAGLNFLYDPERILFPLRRVGTRGDGRWRQVTWADALAEVAAKIRDLRARDRAAQIVFQSDRDITSQAFVRRFCHALGTPNALVAADLGGANKRVAHQLTWGVDLDVDDVANTLFILNFGSNPYEAHILRTSFAQRISEARGVRVQDGRVLSRAKIVTFDPRVSQTAGKSDEWHPIRPGTDAVVALAMARTLLEEGLADRAFVERWTNVTLDDLKKHLEKYTPEVAERESGVRAVDIRRIANEFAACGRATTISAGGATKHANGVQTERAILLLDILTGNIERPGGVNRPVCYRFPDLDPVPPVPTGPSPFFSHPFPGHEAAHEVLPLVAEGKAKVGLYLTYQHNPAYALPDTEAAAEVLKSEALIPFHVAIDTHMSETAFLADLILPAATYLERTELESPPAFSLVPFVSLRQPALRPRGESRPIRQIVLDLARLLGPDVARYFPFASVEEVVEAEAGSIPGLVKAGGLDTLRRHGVWSDPDARPAYKTYEKDGFPTPSKRIEVFSERLKAAGFDPLPTYVPIAAHTAMGEDEFHLVPFQVNVHTHQATANCMWLAEIVHANAAWIHVATAERLGIRTGDRIRVSSRTGAIETTAWVTQGVNPKVIAIADSCGHTQLGRVARAERFESEEPNTRHVWWKREGSGVHPNAVIPAAGDPIGAGAAWMDAVVKVQRLGSGGHGKEVALGAAALAIAAAMAAAAPGADAGAGGDPAVPLPPPQKGGRS